METGSHASRVLLTTLFGVTNQIIWRALTTLNGANLTRLIGEATLVQDDSQDLFPQHSVFNFSDDDVVREQLDRKRGGDLANRGIGGSHIVIMAPTAV